MSLLSDGSQARKTKSDKEMVLVRFEKNGKCVSFKASDVECNNYKFSIDNFLMHHDFGKLLLI